MDRVRETFTDGVLVYGHYTTKLSAKKKVIGKEFVKEGKLFFRELYARESDFLTCSSMGAVLEVKLKTLFPPVFRKVNKTDLVVKIDETEYEVIKADDSDKHYIYFFLAKSGGITREREEQTTT